MKTLAILGVAFLTMSVAPNSVTIRDNQGGWIDDFLTQRKIYERSGTLVKIAGQCASACTIYTGMKNVCLMADAELFFHQGTRLDATMTMLAFMDPDFREFIEKSPEPLPSFESQEFLFLEAKDAIAKGMIKACDGGGGGW